MSEFDGYLPEDLNELAKTAFRQRQAGHVIELFQGLFQKGSEQFPVSPVLERIPKLVSKLILGKLDPNNMQVHRSRPFNRVDVFDETIESSVLKLALAGDPSTIKQMEPTIDGEIYLLAIMGKAQLIAEPENIRLGAFFTGHDKVARGSHQRLLFRYVRPQTEYDTSEDVVPLEQGDTHLASLPFTAPNNVDQYFDALQVQTPEA